MSKINDLIILLRGLENVTRALAAHQQSELARYWSNSSLRPIAQRAASSVENVVSDAIVEAPKVQVP